MVTQQRDSVAAELARAREDLAALAQRGGAGGAEATARRVAEDDEALPSIGVSDSFGAGTTQIPAWLGSSSATGNHPDMLPSRQSPTPKSPLSDRGTRTAFTPQSHATSVGLAAPAEASAASNADGDSVDEVLQCTPSPLRPVEQPDASRPQQVSDAHAHDNAAAAAPESAQAPQMPQCDSPGADSPRTSRWDPDRVHVHVDAHELRTFLAEWKGRQLQGPPPAKLRVMSQYAFASVMTILATLVTARSLQSTQRIHTFDSLQLGAPVHVAQRSIAAAPVASVSATAHAARLQVGASGG